MLSSGTAIYFSPFPPSWERRKEKVIFFLYGINTVCGRLCKFGWERSHFVSIFFFFFLFVCLWKYISDISMKDFKAIILQLMKLKMNTNRRQRTAFNNSYNNNNFSCSFIKSRKKNNNRSNKGGKKNYFNNRKNKRKNYSNNGRNNKLKENKKNYSVLKRK